MDASSHDNTTPTALLLFIFPSPPTLFLLKRIQDPLIGIAELAIDRTLALLEARYGAVSRMLIRILHLRRRLRLRWITIPRLLRSIRSRHHQRPLPPSLLPQRLLIRLPTRRRLQPIHRMFRQRAEFPRQLRRRLILAPALLGVPLRAVPLFLLQAFGVGGEELLVGGEARVGFVHCG